jgi:superfamily II DNA or RNA helicase
LTETNISKTSTGKELYGYQKDALQEIFRRFETAPKDYHLLYQLPTGGGKTVIFSEIVRRYLETFKKKVLVLTHRIELSKQTSRMLNEFGVRNKTINSTAKLDDQHEFDCFVAMVETLKNRLNDEKLDISDIGLVIVDEAHYNSFTKIFKFLMMLLS